MKINVNNQLSAENIYNCIICIDTLTFRHKNTSKELYLV